MLYINEKKMTKLSYEHGLTKENLVTSNNQINFKNKKPRRLHIRWRGGGEGKIWHFREDLDYWLCLKTDRKCHS